MSRKNNQAIAQLITAIEKLGEKVDNCVDFCESVHDEVIPLTMAIDQLLADAPLTMD